MGEPEALTAHLRHGKTRRMDGHRPGGQGGRLLVLLGNGLQLGQHLAAEVRLLHGQLGHPAPYVLGLREEGPAAVRGVAEVLEHRRRGDGVLVGGRLRGREGERTLGRAGGLRQGRGLKRMVGEVRCEVLALVEHAVLLLGHRAAPFSAESRALRRFYSVSGAEWALARIRPPQNSCR